MLPKAYHWPLLAFTMLWVAGCMTPHGPPAVGLGKDSGPIVVQSEELEVALVAVLSAGQTETLVEDPGWREFVLDIMNRGQRPLTVKNVKLLNAEGRYVDSASSYAQIIAPPDPGEQVAGHVARNAAGIAVAQVIPFGGLITSTIFSAFSAYGSGAKTTAKRSFYLRVIKNVELSPGGKVNGSAYFPDIANASQLVIDYFLEDGKKKQIEIPTESEAYLFPVQSKESTSHFCIVCVKIPNQGQAGSPWLSSCYRRAPTNETFQNKTLSTGVGCLAQF